MSKIAKRLSERDARLSRFARNHPAAASDVVNALSKVRHFRGEASDYGCTTCTETADEWQLVELSEREGPEFLLYSNEAAHYSPFCSPCALDAEARRNARLNEIWGR